MYNYELTICVHGYAAGDFLIRDFACSLEVHVLEKCVVHGNLEILFLCCVRSALTHFALSAITVPSGVWMVVMVIRLTWGREFIQK